MRASLALALALAPVLAVAPAHGATLAGYDGSNPFDCVLQDAGTGTTVPDPAADPLCVEYDKTRQNLLQGGIGPFLLGEPARFALAADKCWYYQHDHWHGSVDQHQESTETYNWDGGYFWDKARGVFGVYVEDFTIHNSSVDPRGWPGFPEEWKPYFGYGRGGVQLVDSVPVDPSCVARARERDPYAKPPRPAPERDLRVVVRHRGRACARGPVRGRLAGGATEEVFRADFRHRGRRIARERRAPFGVRIPRRALARRSTRLRVSVLMRGGDREVVRARAPRRC